MVLEATFPEYAKYRQEVGLLGPRSYPPWSRADGPALSAGANTIAEPAAGAPESL
jgi:hypothetical protein